MIQNDVYIEKVAVSLQGGAFNFPMHVGDIQVFEGRNIWPDYIEGVSAGSLAGVFWAMKKTKELYALTEQLIMQGHKMIWVSDFIDEKNGKITVKTEALLDYVGIQANLGTAWKLATQKKKVLGKATQQLLSLPALADNTPLFKLLEQHVTREAIQIPFRCRFVCYDSGEAVSVGPEDFDNDNDFRKAIWASATMPIFWKLIDEIRTKDGKVYRNCGDGGVRDNSPIMSVAEYVDRDQTPNHRWGIVALNCNNDYLAEIYGVLNLFGAAGRTFSIFMNEMGSGDFKPFELANKFAQAAGGAITVGKKTYRYYNFAKIEPYENELGNSLSTDPTALRNRLRLGRKHTEAYFRAQEA